MAAKYTRLSTDDSESGQCVAFDFSSAHQYSSRSADYKSIFTYSNSDMQVRDSDLTYTVVKESFGSRICSFIITSVCFLLVFLTFPISAWISIKIVSDCERLVVFRLGRLHGVRGPGVTLVIPCIDRLKRVDVRMKAFNVPPLQLITCDAGIIEFGADVYYRVSDPAKSVTSVQDLNSQLRGLVRNRIMISLTKVDLESIEDRKDDHIAKIMGECNATAKTWGAEIFKVELSPIKVLQAARTGASLPGFGGQEGLTQVFQQLAQSFLAPGQGHRGGSMTVSEVHEASGAAVASEDIKLLPQYTVTPSHLVEVVRGVLSESLVRSVDAVYQFNLSGQNGGVFYLDLKSGHGSVGEGPARQEPDVTLDLSVRDMQLMFTDNLKPLQAYMSGRLKVSGDLSAAMRLEEVMDKIISSANNSTVAGHTVVNI